MIKKPLSLILITTMFVNCAPAEALSQVLNGIALENRIEAARQDNTRVNIEQQLKLKTEIARYSGQISLSEKIIEILTLDIEKALEAGDSAGFYHKTNMLNKALLNFLDNKENLHVRAIGAGALVNQLASGAVTAQDAEKAYLRFEEILVRTQKCESTECKLAALSAMGLGFSKYRYYAEVKESQTPSDKKRSEKIPEQKHYLVLLKAALKNDYGNQYSKAAVIEGVIPAIYSLGGTAELSEAVKTILNEERNFAGNIKSGLTKGAVQIAAMNALYSLGKPGWGLLRQYAFSGASMPTFTYANINLAYVSDLTKEERAANKANLEFLYCNVDFGLSAQEDWKFRQILAYAYGTGKDGIIRSEKDKNKCAVVPPIGPDPRKVNKEIMDAIGQELVIFAALWYIGPVLGALKNGAVILKHYNKIKYIAKARGVSVGEFYAMGQIKTLPKFGRAIQNGDGLTARAYGGGKQLPKSQVIPQAGVAQDLAKMPVEYITRGPARQPMLRPDVPVAKNNTNTAVLTKPKTRLRPTVEQVIPNLQITKDLANMAGGNTGKAAAGSVSEAAKPILSQSNKIIGGTSAGIMAALKILNNKEEKPIIEKSLEEELANARNGLISQRLMENFFQLTQEQQKELNEILDSRQQGNIEEITVNPNKSTEKEAKEIKPEPTVLSFINSIKNVFNQKNTNASAKNKELTTLSFYSAGGGNAITELNFAPEADLSQITEIAQHDQKLRPLWLLKENGETKFYLKVTDEKEIKTLIALNELQKNKSFESFKDIDILTPSVYKGDLNKLPQPLIQQINSEYAKFKKGSNAWRYGNIPVLTKAVNSGGFDPQINFKGNKIYTKEAIERNMQMLLGKPITRREWESIENYYAFINSKGYVNGDTFHNLILKRDPATMRLVHFSADFQENANPALKKKPSNDKEDLKTIEMYYMRYGFLEHPKNMVFINVENNPLAESKDYTNQNTYKDITNVIAYDNYSNVWGLSGGQTKVDFQLASKETITGLKTIARLKDFGVFRKYKNIDFVFPKIMSFNTAYLPENIKAQLDKAEALAVKESGITEITGVILTAPSREGETLLDLPISKSFKDNPIKIHEWQDIENLIKELNINGVYNGHIFKGLRLHRNDNSKLVLTLLDFIPEAYPAADIDLNILNQYKKRLEAEGVIEEKRTLKIKKRVNPALFKGGTLEKAIALNRNNTVEIKNTSFTPYDFSKGEEGLAPYLTQQLNLVDKESIPLANFKYFLNDFSANKKDQLWQKQFNESIKYLKDSQLKLTTKIKDQTEIQAEVAEHLKLAKATGFQIKAASGLMPFFKFTPKQTFFEYKKFQAPALEYEVKVGLFKYNEFPEFVKKVMRDSLYKGKYTTVILHAKSDKVTIMYDLDQKIHRDTFIFSNHEIQDFHNWHFHISKAVFDRETKSFVVGNFSFSIEMPKREDRILVFDKDKKITFDTFDLNNTKQFNNWLYEYLNDLNSKNKFSGVSKRKDFSAFD